MHESLTTDGLCHERQREYISNGIREIWLAA
jgi:hypothetical protein